MFFLRFFLGLGFAVVFFPQGFLGISQVFHVFFFFFFFSEVSGVL